MAPARVLQGFLSATMLESLLSGLETMGCWRMPRGETSNVENWGWLPLVTVVT
jgi:hypothetical protein